MGQPNLRKLQPEPTKPPKDYTTWERRAEIYNLIQEAGHYRNMDRSQYDLSERYGVSQPQIHKDINRVNEWIEDNLGENAEAELETLKTKAVRDELENGNAAEAYEIMSEHYQNLQSMGEKGKEPDELKHDFGAEAYAALVGAASNPPTDDE